MGCLKCRKKAFETAHFLRYKIIVRRKFDIHLPRRANCGANIFVTDTVISLADVSTSGKKSFPQFFEKRIAQWIKKTKVS